MRDESAKLRCSVFLLTILFLCEGCSVSSQNQANDLGNGDVATSGTSPVSDKLEQFRNTARNEINGIGIGATYEEVVRQYGTPGSIKRGGENPCGSKKTVLQYKGITFTMDDDGEQNIVVLIEINSPKWAISPGISIGLTLDEARSKMGRSGLLTKEDGVESLEYSDGDGYLTFYLKERKVARITRNLNMC